MVLPLLLMTLAAAPAPGVAVRMPVQPEESGPERAAPHFEWTQDWDEYDDEERRDDDEDERRPHVLLSAWGGEALAGAGAGRSSSFFAGEAAWAFDTLDLGLQYAGYRSLRDATREWTPVVLTRVTQRFRTRRGFDAAFSLGLGAGRPGGWVGWFQVALGVRFPIGPLFLGGELAFEQYDLLRLGGGVGVAF